MKDSHLKTAPIPPQPCPRCKVLPGQWHVRGCDVELCPYCGGTLVRHCTLAGQDSVALDDRMQWTGLYPGIAECLSWGWYGRMTAKGWRTCPADHPKAQPDLIRFSVETLWDRENKCFIPKSQSTHAAQGQRQGR
jgi:hypothetical protein